MSECNFVPLSNYDWSFSHVGLLPWNPTVYSLIAAFSGVGIWMTIELTFQVYFTFKKHTGLYFWSILITSWGLTLRSIAYIFKNFVPGFEWILSTTLVEIGWVTMVTGFSVVLYSRLHLVIRGRRILRLVLAMIITDAILFHVPTIVCQYGVSSPHGHNKWVPIIEPMERVQVTAFTIQETIISVLYIWATRKYLRRSYSSETRKAMLVLIVAQIFVILLDVSVIVLDYMEYFNLKAVIHSFVYAIKLKVEFVVLNQLLRLIKRNKSARNLPASADKSADGDNQGRVAQRRISLPQAMESIRDPWIRHSASVRPDSISPSGRPRRHSHPPIIKPALQIETLDPSEAAALNSALTATSPTTTTSTVDRQAEKHLATNTSVPLPEQIPEPTISPLPSRPSSSPLKSRRLFPRLESGTAGNSNAEGLTASRRGSLNSDTQSISQMEKRYLGQSGLRLGR